MKIQAVVITILSLFLLSVKAMAAAAGVTIVPKPVSVSCGADVYRFAPVTECYVTPWEGDSVARAFDLMREDLERAAGTELLMVSGQMTDETLTINSETGDDAPLRLLTDPTLAREAYRLDVAPSGITIYAASPAGFFYALQSLRQLLPYSVPMGQTEVACVSIEDSPRYGWRGFMLDEARHFFGKGETCARYNGDLQTQPFSLASD